MGARLERLKKGGCNIENVSTFKARLKKLLLQTQSSGDEIFSFFAVVILPYVSNCRARELVSVILYYIASYCYCV